MSSEELREWRAYWADRTAANRNRLVERHLSLVDRVARSWSRKLPRRVALDELVSDGTLGLIRAVERYESGRSVRFSTYARYMIIGSIRDQLRVRDWVSRWGRNQQRLGFEVPSALVKWWSFSGLERDVREGIWDPQSQDPGLGLRQKELLDLVCLGESERDAQVIERYFIQGQTQKEIAALFGVVETCITHVIRKVMDRARRRLDRVRVCGEA